MIKLEGDRPWTMTFMFLLGVVSGVLGTLQVSIMLSPARP